jgi:hypothetical protein
VSPSEDPQAVQDVAEAVEAALADVGGDAPLVGIIMGSQSDMPVMQKAADDLTERGISNEIKVASAHRDPDVVAEYAKTARSRGLRVVIAGAGLADRGQAAGGGGGGCWAAAHALTN